MDENAEAPEIGEVLRGHGRPFTRYQTEHEWRLEVVVLLRGIFECVASAPWMVASPGDSLPAVSGELPVQEAPVAAFHEVSVKAEPVAASAELPVESEPLPTWILTDEAVSRVEDAIEQEQRVRGRAYGG